MKTKGKMSNVILSHKDEQIKVIISERPYEAMTIAENLAFQYPEDERAVVLCLRTALRVKATTGEDVLAEDIYELGRKYATAIYMSPVLSSLHVVSKALLGKGLTEEDVVSLRKAMKMGPDISREIIEEAKLALGQDHALFSSLTLTGAWLPPRE